MLLRTLVAATQQNDNHGVTPGVGDAIARPSSNRISSNPKGEDATEMKLPHAELDNHPTRNVILARQIYKQRGSDVLAGWRLMGVCLAKTLRRPAVALATTVPDCLAGRRMVELGSSSSCSVGSAASTTAMIMRMISGVYAIVYWPMGGRDASRGLLGVRRGDRPRAVGCRGAPREMHARAGDPDDAMLFTGLIQGFEGLIG